MENGGEKERAAARALLLRVIDDYDDPLNDFDFLIAKETLAELDAADGALDEADAQYRAALHLSSESNVRGRYSVCQARIAAANGDTSEAATHAIAALREASTAAPDFPRHPDIGHVRADESLLRELKRLAQDRA